MARPTKYKEEETIKAVESIIEQMTAKDFFSFCGIEHIALALGVCRKTLYNWMDDYPEFLHTIKRWETKRNALFYSLGASKQVSPAVWIFLAKNWLGMSDRQEVDNKLSGGLKLEIEKIITDQRPDE